MRKQAARRLGLAFGQLPVAVERTPGPLPTMQTPSAITIRVDGDGMMPASARASGGGRQVRGGERQKAAQAVVEDQNGVITLHFHPAAPSVDLLG